MGVIISYMVVREGFSEQMEIRVEGGKRAREEGTAQAEMSECGGPEQRSKCLRACSGWHRSCKAS